MTPRAISDCRPCAILPVPVETGCRRANQGSPFGGAGTASAVTERALSAPSGGTSCTARKRPRGGGSALTHTQKGPGKFPVLFQSVDKASQSLRPQAQIHQISVLVRLCCAKTHFSAGGVCERSECMKRLLPSRRQSFLCRRFKPSPKGKALWCVAGTTFPHPVSVFSFPRTGTKTAGCAPAGDAR